MKKGILRIKSINELVAEGYEVDLDYDYDYINISKKGNSESIDVSDYVHIREMDGEDYLQDFYDNSTYYDCDDGLCVPKIFVKSIDTNEIDSFDTNEGDYTLLVKKDLSLEIGCQSFDKKTALKIAKVILVANGYEVE